jgi:hypothetical protein
MDTIVIQGSALIEAAEKAYLEGRLQRQKENTHTCYYRSPNGNPCAIGAALTNEEAKLLDSFIDQAIDNLLEYNYVEVVGLEFKTIVEFQIIHDTQSFWEDGKSLRFEDHLVKAKRELEDANV